MGLCIKCEVTPPSLLGSDLWWELFAELQGKKLSLHNYSIVIPKGIVSSQGIKVNRRTGMTMLVLGVLYEWLEDENSVTGSVSIASVISCGCSVRSVISIGHTVCPTLHS